MTTEIHRPADWNLLRPAQGGELDDDAAFLTTVVGLRDVIAWGRGNSVWPMTFGLACCAIEMMAFASTRYDVDRLGCGAFRATPRQADLMITAGTVTYKMAHRVRRLWEQMPDPKWVIAMGACTVGGGPYSKWGYHVVQGVDLVIPVDVHVPGCPPRPEALIDGLKTLQDLIMRRGSIEQQAAIADAVRKGQQDVLEGRIPGMGAPAAPVAAPVAKRSAPKLSAPAAPAKAPPLPGGLKLPPGMKLPSGPPKQAAAPAPAAPAAPAATTGGATAAAGPMPPAVLAANRDTPSGPPQPYEPSSGAAAPAAPAPEPASDPAPVATSGGDGGGGDQAPTALAPSGPLPPEVLAANRDRPSGPPQPYTPLNQR